MVLFCENASVNYFREKAPKMFDNVLNMPLLYDLPNKHTTLIDLVFQNSLEGMLFQHLWFHC